MSDRLSMRHQYSLSQTFYPLLLHISTLSSKFLISSGAKKPRWWSQMPNLRLQNEISQTSWWRHGRCVHVERDIFEFFIILTMFYVLVHSVKYEDPQALGGLASALDVRQQNAGGVSTLMHVVWYSFHPYMECGCCVIYMADEPLLYQSVLSPRSLPACDGLWYCMFYSDICPVCSDTWTLIKQKGVALCTEYCYYSIAKINLLQRGKCVLSVPVSTRNMILISVLSLVKKTWIHSSHSSNLISALSWWSSFLCV